MMKLWKRYKQYIRKQFIGSYQGEIHDISYWRARIFMNFMLYLLPTGIIVYIPSMIMSIVADLPAVAIIDTIVILVIAWLSLDNKIGFEKKKHLLVACFYTLSFILLVFLGSMGPGLIYLIAVSVFSVLIISKKTGYLSVAINFCIYCVLALGLLFPNTGIAFFQNYSFGAWIAVGSNFLLINLIIVVSVSALLNGLQKTILKEKTLQNMLKKESTKLKEAKDKAIQSDKLKSAFLANMSHEIRTPLNAIIGFSNILYKKNDSKSKKQYIDIINKSSNQLLNLINDIIDLSKIEAGGINLDIEQIKFREFTETIIASMKESCPKNLEFKYYVNETMQEEYIGIDEHKVTQVITNLVTNSFKYTIKGFIELRLNLSDDKKALLFSVKDTGIGISNEKQEKVFERFYQENTMQSGVGLGLSICASLVKAMNGKISLKSEIGKGSTFFVELPNILENNNISVKEKTPEPPKEIAINEGKRILIAEDDENSFAVLKEILKEGKHLITRTVNGREVIEQIKKEVFDVVLMDLKMPVLDGYEATKQIRQFDKMTPIIALTALAFDSDEKKALQAGCNDYLAKPIDYDKFNQLISKYTN